MFFINYVLKFKFQPRQINIISLIFKCDNPVVFYKC